MSPGEDRIARLSDAVDVLETSQAKLELARARGDLGVALVRTAACDVEKMRDDPS